MAVHNDDIQRVISTILFASRAASLFYYGDEIGMKTTPPTRKEDVKDPVGLTGWPKEKGRDGERTPMQWDAATNAGFSNRYAVAAGSADLYHRQREGGRLDPNSLLAWYKSLIQLKKTNPVLGARRQRDAGY